MRIRKPRKSEIILLSIIVLMIAIPSILLPNNKSTTYKSFPPSGYAAYIVDEVTGREDYQNTNINGRMDLFYNFLIDISKNGYEVDEPEGVDYYELVLYPEEIIVDRENYRISFCEHYYGIDRDDRWFDYDFAGEYLIDRERSAAIHELIDNWDN